MSSRDYPRARGRMVLEEVVGKGITDARVIEAMKRVPRHRFVPTAMEHDAYSGLALPIGSGQTISAPQMVGLMTEALDLVGEENVLEIGTGSGYQAAVLAELTHRVITIERLPELARRAQSLFSELGLDGIVVKVGDGTQGYLEAAPYDRIIVTAAAPQVPQTLLSQLAEGGFLLAPVGERMEQVLMRYHKTATGIEEESFCRCVFVPLVGREGYAEPGE